MTFIRLNYLSDNGLCHGGNRLTTNKRNFNPDFPIVTVITAVFNGRNNIEETILSIINQNYTNIEYIIIDGGSTDGTLDIIRKYDSKIDYWVSGKDSGISDAFNKGIILSSGDYINFQGDGDGFLNENSIKELFTNVGQSNNVIIAARIARVDINGKVLYVTKKHKSFNKESLLFKMSLPHQSLFMSINFFYNHGLFNPVIKYSMDYDLLLRAYKNFPKVSLSNIIVAKWRKDGLGNKKEFEIYQEYNKIKVYNKISNPPTLFLINKYIIFKYHLKNILKISGRN
jgi:glycosyltransferase involved in cell wall biosynthesis